MLADVGANVIKVEPPSGDENRLWPPFTPDQASCNFNSVNRGKRGITLDLKTMAGQSVLRSLVTKADVLIHNFLPDTAARLGLGPEMWSETNPRLVVCEMSGYGAMGQMANKPGYDLMMQAFAGAMAMTGYEDSPPVRTGLSFIDMSTGMSAYGAITTALLARKRTGRGTTV